jgi:hypothetical protein
VVCVVRIMPVAWLVALTVASATDAPCASCVRPTNIANPALWPCAPCAVSSTNTANATRDPVHRHFVQIQLMLKSLIGTLDRSNREDLRVESSIWEIEDLPLTKGVR